VARDILAWQSKLVLLLVLPAIATDVAFGAEGWLVRLSPVTIWTMALSTGLGLVAWGVRAATPGAAITGTVLASSLMFSTASVPYSPIRTGLLPVLAVLVLTSIATRFGRRRKEALGTAEQRTGRKPSQVAANLGVAALISCPVAQNWQWDQSWLMMVKFASPTVFVAGLAALCEAAADTVSSELGQVLTTRPRMITSFRAVAAGTDGAISLGGTVAGLVAAGMVAGAGGYALRCPLPMLAVSWAGGAFGLLFDSLLGATAERRGWLNNDAVNFLSTLCASVFALALLGVMAHLGGMER
jgi:uncharacterized protein (TIGR00297 family)